jgi:hypothetical protein
MPALYHRAPWRRLMGPFVEVNDRSIVGNHGVRMITPDYEHTYRYASARGIIEPRIDILDVTRPPIR